MTGSHKAGRWEILGAWLHVWTPPRGVEIPPVPWRTIGYATAATVVVLGVIAAFAIPRIDSGKRKGAAQRARQEAKLTAAERARVTRDQALHRGTGDLAAAHRAVLADARSRTDKPIRGLTCAPTPGASAVGVYDCTAITDRIKGTSLNAAGELGYPFRLKVDAAHDRFLWCKQDPPPGERSIPDPSRLVPLPPACRA